MSELTDKEQIIKKVYTNAVSGYGSVRDTYVQANNIYTLALHTSMLKNT